MSKEQQAYVITGATSYLGEELAKYYSSEGNKVLLTSRKPISERSRKASECLEKLRNDNVIYLSDIDLIVESSLDQLRDEIKRFIPNKFHVINCVGYFPDYKMIEDMSIIEAKKVFDSNVLSLYNVAHKLIPLMCERGGGHFIGFSAHTAYQHYPKMSAFTAAKIAVESLIQGISNEYLENGVIANTIALATLDTEEERRIKPKGDSSSWLKTDEVCTIVDNLIRSSSNLINGSIIHAYKYSKTYFGQSYFDRIKK
ncbi:MAG: SDR family oxidoreductase [Bacteroidales bacterium]|nr:SDR family oxidoreductase [Bacteroidales bacterium]